MPEWISVKERLPEERQFVLLCSKYERIVALGYRQRVRYIDFWECLNPTLGEYEVPWVGAGIVEFWMPLPEPPKEVNE